MISSLRARCAAASLLLLSLLVPTALRAADSDAPTMREKLRARILASMPPPAPAKPAADPKDAPAPSTASEPKAALPPSKAIFASATFDPRVKPDAAGSTDRRDRNRLATQFLPASVDKSSSLASAQRGGQWSPDQGWSFLRLSEGPTRRLDTASP